MILMLSVIIIIGIIVINISSSFYKKTELERLKNTSSLFISCIIDEYNNDTPDKDNIQKLHKLFIEENNISIYIYDNNKNCILSCDEKQMPLSNNIKSYIDNGKYLELSSNGLSSEEPYLIYGDKFSVKNSESSGKMYILAYGSTHNIIIFTMQILSIIQI